MSTPTFYNRLNEDSLLQQIWDSRYLKDTKQTGRPPLQIDYQAVEEAAAICKTNLEIAAELGIHRGTFNRYRDGDPKFKTALERGRARRKAEPPSAKPAKAEILAPILLPPNITVDLEKEVEIGASVHGSIENARTHSLFCLYQVKWQREVKFPRISLNPEFREEFVAEIVKLIEEEVIEVGSVAMAAVMLLTHIVGFRRGLIETFLGFDRYFIEGILVRMFDCQFYRTDGSLAVDWADAKDGTWVFICDLLAVEGSSNRWFNDEGTVMYQKSELADRPQEDEFMPIQCKCSNRVTFKAWKDQMSARLKPFQCEACFTLEEKPMQVTAEPETVEETPVVENETSVAGFPAPDEVVKETIHAIPPEVTTRLSEDGRIAITINITETELWNLTHLAKMKESTVDRLLGEAVFNYLTYENEWDHDEYWGNATTALEKVIDRKNFTFTNQALPMWRDELLTFFLEFTQEKPNANMQDLRLAMARFTSDIYLKRLKKEQV
jgi:hypothetical protein